MLESVVQYNLRLFFSQLGNLSYIGIVSTKVSAQGE